MSSGNDGGRVMGERANGEANMEKAVELDLEGYTELSVVDDVDLGQFDGPVVALRDADGRLFVVRTEWAVVLPTAALAVQSAAA